MLKASELQDLATIVPPEYHDRIRLPFIIIRRTDLGRSVFTVSGERIDQFAVQKILGNTKDGLHESYKHGEQTYIYRPELTELVRRFHSLVAIGFGIPEELSDYAPRRD